MNEQFFFKIRLMRSSKLNVVNTLRLAHNSLSKGRFLFSKMNSPINRFQIKINIQNKKMKKKYCIG